MIRPANQARLSPKQVEAFRREGYLVFPDPVFPENEFHQLKSYFENLLANLPSDKRPESMEVPMELDAGQASLHDARIIHGSKANCSHLRPCGYTMRFMSSKLKFNDAKAGAYHQVYLARVQCCFPVPLLALPTLALPHAGCCHQ